MLEVSVYGIPGDTVVTVVAAEHALKNLTGFTFSNLDLLFLGPFDYVLCTPDDCDIIFPFFLESIWSPVY